MTVYIDIETSGLSLIKDKFVVGGLLDSRGEEYIERDVDKYVERLMMEMALGTEICGHSIIPFDLPFLAKKTKHSEQFIQCLRKNPKLIIDTHILSRMNTGNNFENSMDAVLKRLGIDEKKYEINDWSATSDMDLVNRVKKDIYLQKIITMKFFPWHKSYLHMSPIFPFWVDALANGIPFKHSLLEDTKVKLLQDKMKYKSKVYLDFKNMNCNSIKQINKAVIKKYGRELPYTKKYSKKKKEWTESPSFNKDNRHECIALFPELEHVANYRDCCTQLSFLANRGKKSLISSDCNDGERIYPGISLLSQATYRSGYKEPPVNQVDKRIRHLIGQEGYTIIGIDIKSLEFWEFAESLKTLTGNHDLLDEMLAGVNPKERTLEVFHGLFDNVEEEKRMARAKTLNFAVIFGQQMDGTRNLLRLDESFKQDVSQAREDRFPGLSEMMDILNELKDDKGFVENKYGLKIKAFGHELLNYYIQSAGAMASDVGLGHLYLRITKEIPEIKALLKNHDEIQLIKKGIVDKEKILTIVRDTEAWLIENTWIPYPIKFDVKFGSSWGESH